MHTPEKNTDLERALEKHLGRVSAPEELWGRVQTARSRPVVRTQPMWPVWATAAATVAVLMAAVAVWQSGSAPMSVEAMAVEALTNGPEKLRFQSSEASEIRMWLRANAGMDVPLPPRHSSLVEIEGASVLEGAGATVAEIAYRVGDHRATLLITQDPTGKRTYPSHEIRLSEAFEDARVSSWSMRGQSYTLAWAAPGEFRVACLLCHGQEPLMN